MFLLNFRLIFFSPASGEKLKTLTNLQQQIAANRVTVAVKAETSYWDGRIKFRFYQVKEALERYEAALAFYREIGNRLGEANTLRAIGDVLQFLDRRTEALERYEAALAFYCEIGDDLGTANILQNIGDILQLLGRHTETLERYESSLAFYHKIRDNLGEINELRPIGYVLQFLKRYTEALEKYVAALAVYRNISIDSEEINKLQPIGNVLQALKRSTEALERYESAFLSYRRSGTRLLQSLIYSLIGTIVGVFIIIGIDKYYYYSASDSMKQNFKEQTGTNDLITLVLTTQSTLVAGAIGFYFVKRDAK